MLEINNGGGKMENSGWIIVFVGAGILMWVIAAWLMRRGKKSECRLPEERNSGQGLVALGSTFVVLGIVFAMDRLIGYSFIGTGVVLSIIGAIKSRRKARRSSMEMR
jgi:hypothetical protein